MAGRFLCKSSEGSLCKCTCSAETCKHIKINQHCLILQDRQNSHKVRWATDTVDYSLNSSLDLPGGLTWRTPDLMAVWITFNSMSPPSCTRQSANHLFARDKSVANTTSDFAFGQHGCKCKWKLYFQFKAMSTFEKEYIGLQSRSDMPACLTRNCCHGKIEHLPWEHWAVGNYVSWSWWFNLRSLSLLELWTQFTLFWTEKTLSISHTRLVIRLQDQCDLSVYMTREHPNLSTWQLCSYGIDEHSCINSIQNQTFIFNWDCYDCRDLGVPGSWQAGMHRDMWVASLTTVRVNIMPVYLSSNAAR